MRQACRDENFLLTAMVVLICFLMEHHSLFMHAR